MNWWIVIMVIAMAIFSTELVNSVKDRRKFSLADDYVTASVFGLLFITALLSALVL